MPDAYFTRPIFFGPRLLALAAVIALALPAAARNPGAAPVSAPRPAQPVSQPAPAPAAQAGRPQVRFKAPAGVGAATGTLAGATRGNNREWMMFVAAPAGFGLSGVDQPVLYWYVSRALTTAPALMLVESGGDQPLLDVKLPVPAAPGFQRIDLKSMGVRLEAGKEYVWQVSLDSRAGTTAGTGRMVDAVGRIRWLVPPASLARWVDGGDDLEAAVALAEAGYWYDASARLRQLAARVQPADAGGFSDAEVSLYESAGLGHLVRKAAAPQ